MARQNPNIIITGTPGVGKTTHAEQLARATGFKHVSVNQIVKDEGFHEGKDEETGSWIVDEDKVRFELLSHFSLDGMMAHLQDVRAREDYCAPWAAARSGLGAPFLLESVQS